MIKKALFFIFLLFFCFSLPVDSAKKKPLKIRQEAEHLSYNEKMKLYHLWGNVRISHKDTLLVADEAYYNSETQVAHVTGNLRLTQPGVSLTGERIVAFYKLKKVMVEGNVLLFYEYKKRKKKIEEKELKKAAKKTLSQSPITLTCSSLEYYWEKKEMFAEGNVQLTQGDKFIISDVAIYKDDEQLAIFEGNVYMERAIKDNLRCDRLILNLKEETLVAEGNITGNMELELEEKEKVKAQEKEDEEPADIVAEGVVEGEVLGKGGDQKK